MLDPVFAQCNVCGRDILPARSPEEAICHRCYRPYKPTDGFARNLLRDTVPDVSALSGDALWSAYLDHVGKERGHAPRDATRGKSREAYALQIGLTPYNNKEEEIKR
jgi:hypothetical protein